jgi:hypothetical protein
MHSRYEIRRRLARGVARSDVERRGTQHARSSTMRLRTLIMPLALGLVARAVIRHRRNQRARGAHDAGPWRADSYANDPGDPVQGFDEVSELQVSPLDVDALSIEDVGAAQDLAGLESEVDEIASNDDAAIEMIDVELAETTRDAGDLYGAHTAPAVDRDHPDDDTAAREGQTWIEALETSAIENGAEPELELDDIVDDEDVLRPPHPADMRDTPVADHGSGGRRGL